MQDYCNLSCDINDLTSPLSNADYYVIDLTVRLIHVPEVEVVLEVIRKQ